MDLLNKIKLIFTNEQEEKDETTKEIIQIEELPSKLESKINELTALKSNLKMEYPRGFLILKLKLMKK